MNSKDVQKGGTEKQGRGGKWRRKKEDPAEIEKKKRQKMTSEDRAEEALWMENVVDVPLKGFPSESFFIWDRENHYMHDSVPLGLELRHEWENGVLETVSFEGAGAPFLSQLFHETQRNYLAYYDCRTRFHAAIPHAKLGDASLSFLEDLVRVEASNKVMMSAIKKSKSLSEAIKALEQREAYDAYVQSLEGNLSRFQDLYKNGNPWGFKGWINRRSEKTSLSLEGHILQPVYQLDRLRYIIRDVTISDLPPEDKIAAKAFLEGLDVVLDSKKCNAFRDIHKALNFDRDFQGGAKSYFHTLHLQEMLHDNELPAALDESVPNLEDLDSESRIKKFSHLLTALMGMAESLNSSSSNAFAALRISAKGLLDHTDKIDCDWFLRGDPISSSTQKDLLNMSEAFIKHEWECKRMLSKLKKKELERIRQAADRKGASIEQLLEFPSNLTAWLSAQFVDSRKNIRDGSSRARRMDYVINLFERLTTSLRTITSRTTAMAPTMKGFCSDYEYPDFVRNYLRDTVEYLFGYEPNAVKPRWEHRLEEENGFSPADKFYDDKDDSYDIKEDGEALRENYVLRLVEEETAARKAHEANTPNRRFTFTHKRDFPQERRIETDMKEIENQLLDPKASILEDFRKLEELFKRLVNHTSEKAFSLNEAILAILKYKETISRYAKWCRLAQKDLQESFIEGKPSALFKSDSNAQIRIEQKIDLPLRRIVRYRREKTMTEAMYLGPLELFSTFLQNLQDSMTNQSDWDGAAVDRRPFEVEEREITGRPAIPFNIPVMENIDEDETSKEKEEEEKMEEEQPEEEEEEQETRRGTRDKDGDKENMVSRIEHKREQRTIKSNSVFGTCLGCVEKAERKKKVRGNQMLTFPSSQHSCTLFPVAS